MPLFYDCFVIFEFHCDLLVCVAAFYCAGTTSLPVPEPGPIIIYPLFILGSHLDESDSSIFEFLELVLQQDDRSWCGMKWDHRSQARR
jgi:hypothetical protein